MSSDSIGSLPSDTEDDEAWRLQYYISKFGVAANVCLGLLHGLFVPYVA